MRPISVLCLLVLTLSACGIKGSLYLPPPLPQTPRAQAPADHNKPPVTQSAPLAQ